MESTLATVVIEDADRTQAQSDLGDGHFQTPLSKTGKAPATHWLDGGWWYDVEIEAMQGKYPIFFTDDYQSVLAELKLLTIPD